METPRADPTRSRGAGVERDRADEREARRPPPQEARTGGPEQPPRVPPIEELEGGELPAVLTELLELPELGPTRVRRLHRELGVDSLEALIAAVESGEVRSLPGFGAAVERKLIDALHHGRGARKRVPWSAVEGSAAALIAHLREVHGVTRAELVGSFRRRRATVGDLDLLATGRRGTPVCERLSEHPEVAEVVSRGRARSTLRLRGGVTVDVHVVPERSFGAALHVLTGSKAHTVAVRRLALTRDLRLNEYGVFAGARRLGGRTEDEVYAAVGLPWIPPELREDRGEVEAALAGRLPALVELADLRGDLHAHAPDEAAGLERLVEAARARRYEYLAVCPAAPCREAGPLRELGRRLERLGSHGSGLVLLRAAEVEVLEDGSLALPDELLAELDLVVCAVHAHLDLPVARQTARLLRAIRNPFCHVLAHPTGRVVGARGPLSVDVDALTRAAARYGCILELNAQPQRLDLPDLACRAARAAGARLSISSGAQAAGELDLVRHGVAHARRGWIEAPDVVNTRGLPELRALLRKA